MAFLLCVVAAPAILQMVSGQYVCPSGHDDESDGPACARGRCLRLARCRRAATRCQFAVSFSAAWIIPQAADGGCAEDTKFFDLKTLSAEVGCTQGEADVKAACCTRAAIGIQCHAVQARPAVFDTNKALADGANGNTVSQSKFQELCCDVDNSCARFSGAWLISQAIGAGCAQDTKFFDLEKLSAEVGGSQEEVDVKAACCTPFCSTSIFSNRRSRRGLFDEAVVEARAEE